MLKLTKDEVRLILKMMDSNDFEYIEFVPLTEYGDEVDDIEIVAVKNKNTTVKLFNIKNKRR